MMVCPKVMAELRVSSTLAPDVATLEIDVAEPSTSISKAEAEAVVNERASL